ncbi:Pao retrotransposon peptidase family protein [Aphelenchoides avenae]|nr:Pao retrotransposon peptidase family protein [Aphelenchus avenae]
MTKKPTKRVALKKKASIFDPLNVISPVVLKANLFIQDLWKKKSDWDHELEQADADRWYELLQDWNQGEIVIPRVVTSRHPQASYQIHACGDASAVAIGVCVYVRVWTPQGIHVHLLGAKSRVNPIREISMPKLEVTAQVLAFRYAHFIRKELHVDNVDIYLWTDSQCTQKWICSKRLPSPVYVANRIKEIRTDDECYIAYIKTDENPADIASRGATIAELRESQLWWHGPSWLSQPEEAWPEKPIKIKDCIPMEEEEDIPELTVARAVRAPKPVRVDENKFDTYERACRRTAWLIRFLRVLVLKKTRNVSDRLLQLHTDGPTTGPLTAAELRVAELATLKLDQQQFPPTEDEVRRFGLHPNPDGILVCSDRLKNADLPEEGRSPAFLSSESRLLRLLIMHLHRKIMHGRVQNTLAELRQRYFSPRARATVKRVLRADCLVCRKIKAKPFKLPPIAPSRRNASPRARSLRE